MKKHFFFATTLMAAAIAVAVVSCKKETPNAMSSKQPQATKMFYPEGVDDMNAYLKDFKQKMQTVTRGDDEMLSLEEAAWHLSSVANYDFANVNVAFTDLRYDTLYYQVRVTNGQVSLTDLNAVYANMASDIDAFYHSLDLQEKHFRFIGASVSANGEVKVSVVTSFVWLDHLWYFTDWVEVCVMCDSLFNEEEHYVWNGLGKLRLHQAINLLEGRLYVKPENNLDRGYYLYLTDVWFEYQDNTDPHNSPFYTNSRLFAKQDDTFATPVLSFAEMCYCLDSYLGLPFEYIAAHPELQNACPVNWAIYPRVIKPFGSHWHTFYHDLKVTLATRVSGISNDY